MSEDFPTLDLPITAISGKSGAGHSVVLEADLTKATELICILGKERLKLESDYSNLFFIFKGKNPSTVLVKLKCQC